MSREIKFRVWDGTAMYDATEYPDWTLGDFANAFRMAPEYRPDPERYKLMQYTGLKDKNGKEIYEGDIVESDVDVFTVEYGMQGVDAFVGMGWNLWSHYDLIDGEYEYNLNRLIANTEVIGNIHENPELLKP